jgi:hypothetical protein
MRTVDDLDARNLTHGETLVSVAHADGDGFIIFDVSHDANPKRCTGTSLKTYIGSIAWPSATEAQTLVANSSGEYVSQTLSGDATVNPSGVLMLANDSVGKAQVEAGAITAAKVLITGATLLSGSVVAGDEMLLYDASSTSIHKLLFTTARNELSFKRRSKRFSHFTLVFTIGTKTMKLSLYYR